MRVRPEKRPVRNPIFGRRDENNATGLGVLVEGVRGGVKSSMVEGAGGE